MVALGVCVLLAGWVALMASMQRHADLFGALNDALRATLRTGAWVAFASSLALFVGARGIQQGPVYWIVNLMLGAIAIVLLGAWVSSRRQRRPD